MNYYTTTEISGIQMNVIIKFVAQRTKMHIEHGFLKKKKKKSNHFYITIIETYHYPE